MFEPDGQYFYGPEARRPWRTARDTFMAQLDALLNTPELRELLERPVAVTASADLAEALYTNTSDEAIVFVVRDRLPASTWGRKHLGTFHEGSRYEVSLTLDFSAGAEAEDPNEPVSLTEADQDLADAIVFHVRAHVAAFDALGLHNIEIEPDAEKQGAGIGRNPHRVSFLMFCLPTREA